MRNRHAFTLIEVLVVVTILGILAALGFGALSSSRKSTAKIEGIAKLREIGAAINSYALDNDGQLPGPLKQGQSPTPASSGHLVSYVKPYMGPEEALAVKNAQPFFVTKAWMNWFQSSDLPSAVVYFVNTVVNDEFSPGTYYFPFGNKGSRTRNNRAVTNHFAWKTNIKSSQTPAIWDWTGTENISVPYGHLYNGINVLYFDWHVEHTTQVEQASGHPYKPEGW